MKKTKKKKQKKIHLDYDLPSKSEWQGINTKRRERRERRKKRK